MTKSQETAARIAQILESAAKDDSPVVLRMAELLVESSNQQARLAVEAFNRLQQESAASRDLLRDVMIGKLAIFNLPAARTYANLSHGRSGGGSSATAGKSSPSAAGSTTSPTAGDEDSEVEPMSDEDVLADLDPTALRASGHSFVPPR